jgi:hypothetical protein
VVNIALYEIHVMILRVMMPFSQAGGYQHFSGTYCLIHSEDRNMFLQDLGIHLPDCMVSVQTNLFMYMRF